MCSQHNNRARFCVDFYALDCEDVINTSQNDELNHDDVIVRPIAIAFCSTNRHNDSVCRRRETGGHSSSLDILMFLRFVSVVDGEEVWISTAANRTTIASNARQNRETNDCGVSDML